MRTKMSRIAGRNDNEDQWRFGINFSKNDAIKHFLAIIKDL